MGGIMSKTEQFKIFIRKNPHLIQYVNNGSITWQKFFEMWDLYGEDSEAWNNYKETKNSNLVYDLGLKNVVDSVKNINVDSIVKGLNGLQKLLAIAQDFFGKKEVKSQEDPYIPRPVHKRFED